MSNMPVNDALNYLASWQLNGLKLGLAVTFYVANVLDYYTTKKGLEAGLREGNPFARAIMRMGWRRYQAMKLIAPLGLVAQGLTSNDSNFVWYAVFAVGASLFIYATIQNSLLIAGRKLAKAE